MNTKSTYQLLFLFSMVLICGCAGDKKNGACGSGKELKKKLVRINDNPNLIFLPGTGTIGTTDNEVYYHYPGNGKVQFFIGFNQQNICTKEHLNVYYEVEMTNVPQTLNMKLFGDAYWSAYSDDLAFHNGAVTAGEEYSGTLELGFKQAFDDGPGDVDFYTNVEFVSFGNFPSDSTYFVDHIEDMFFSYTYDKYIR